MQLGHLWKAGFEFLSFSIALLVPINQSCLLHGSVPAGPSIAFPTPHTSGSALIAEGMGILASCRISPRVMKPIVLSSQVPVLCLVPLLCAFLWWQVGYRVPELLAWLFPAGDFPQPTRNIG